MEKPRKSLKLALIIISCVTILTWPLPFPLHLWTNLNMPESSIITIAVICIFSYLLLHAMNAELRKPKRLSRIVIGIVTIIDTTIFAYLPFPFLYYWLSPDGLLSSPPHGWSKVHLISYVISHETKAISLTLIVSLAIISLLSYLIIKGSMKYTRRFREKQLLAEKEQEEQERQQIQEIEKRREAEIERRKKAEDELDNLIRGVLKTMDSSPKSYANEEEANHQLYLFLKDKMPDIDIRWQPKLSETRTADLSVGNTIIEGKLDLIHQTEVDRLVGQLEDYCSDEKYKVKIVVYGEIKPEFYQRLQARIDGLYFGRVALLNLPSPTRRRRESNQ